MREFRVLEFDILNVSQKHMLIMHANCKLRTDIFHGIRDIQHSPFLKVLFTNILNNRLKLRRNQLLQTLKTVKFEIAFN